MSAHEEIPKAIVKTCRKLVEYKLTYASLGNVSARCGEYIYITPSGVRFDELSPEQIVRVTMEGKVIGDGTPSVELPMHLAIYKNITEAKAVIHAHTIFSTMLGSLKGKIISIHEEAKVFGVQFIPICRSAMHGTDELAKNVVASLKESRATVIPFHGVVAYGDSLDTALQTLEVVENISKMKILELLLHMF